MKKFFALLLIITAIICFASCDKAKGNGDGNALETAQADIKVENKNGTIDLTEDSVKVLLGAYGSEKLGLQHDISEYTLQLSATEYNGVDGCKVEAFYDGEKTAEGTFMIADNICYVYDKTQMKYISLSKTTSKNDTTASSGDDGITFQYHKENNRLMQERFSKYSIEKLGLSKEVAEYVFVVNGYSGYSLDETKIYYVDVCEKNGDKVDVKLAFSEDAEFVYSTDKNGYLKLEK